MAKTTLFVNIFMKRTTSINGIAVGSGGHFIIGSVYLKDSSNPPKELTKKIDLIDQGTFTFDISGLTKPLLLKATGTTTDDKNYTVYMLMPEPISGNFSINIASTAIAATAAGVTNLDALYANLKSSDTSKMLGNYSTAYSTAYAGSYSKTSSIMASYIDEPLTVYENGLYVVNGNKVTGTTHNWVDKNAPMYYQVTEVTDGVGRINFLATDVMKTVDAAITYPSNGGWPSIAGKCSVKWKNSFSNFSTSRQYSILGKIDSDLNLMWETVGADNDPHREEIIGNACKDGKCYQ